MLLPALCAMFFLSGCAALLFETLWFHQAGLALGNSVWASSLVLAGFMGGLAIGNGVVGRIGHRFERPVRLYARLEIAIAVTGVSLVYLLPLVTPMLAPLLRPLLEQPWIVNPLRLGTAFTLMLLPSAAMGATLPLLVAALFRRQGSFGRALGLLYGWNTLGAVAGALLGEVALLELLGVRGTAFAAAGMNVTAAVIATRLSRQLDGEGAAQAREPADPLPARAGGLLAAAFLAGGTLLALEVVWFRLLLLFVDGTDLTFAVMLAVVLAGIGLGGLAGAAWMARSQNAWRSGATLAFFAGFVSVAAYTRLDGVLSALGGRPGSGWGVLWLAVPLMFPVSVASGALFTLLGDALQRAAPAETRSAGFLALANTAGAMLGPIVAGFALLPWLGVERSVHLLAAIYGLTGLCVMAGGVRPASGRPRAAIAVAAAGLLLAVAFFPTGWMRERYVPESLRPYRELYGFEPVAMREGLTETIVYMRRPVLGRTLYHQMLTNGYSMSATSVPSRRYMKLFVHLPVALRPEPKNALLISYGVGMTAKALTDTRSLERIDVVDISRDILEMNSIVYPDPADHPLEDERVVVHIEDGRHFLQTTERRFDLITGEPPPPTMAGVVNLYTREYFELVHDRLSDGGVVSYWLPVHSLNEGERDTIIRAFCEAFADCSLWSGAHLDWVLLGTRGDLPPVDPESFGRQWHDPVVAATLREIGVETPEQLGGLFMAGAEHLAELTAGVPVLVDDRPRLLGEGTTGQENHRAWLDVGQCRMRFMQSAFVERHWPESLRRPSLPGFQLRRYADAYFFGDFPGIPARLQALETLLTHTRSWTLPLWLLHSGVADLAIARELEAEGSRDAYVPMQLGAEAMADRRYAAAAVHYRAARERGAKRAALYLEIYALHKAGERAEARELTGSLLDPEAERDQRFLQALRGIGAA